MWNKMDLYEEFYKKMKVDISNQIKHVDPIPTLKTENNDPPF